MSYLYVNGINFETGEKRVYVRQYVGDSPQKGDPISKAYSSYLEPTSPKSYGKGCFEMTVQRLKDYAQMPGRHQGLNAAEVWMKHHPDHEATKQYILELQADQCERDLQNHIDNA